MFNSKAVSKEKAKISKWQNSKTLHTHINKLGHRSSLLDKEWPNQNSECSQNRNWINARL